MNQILSCSFFQSAFQGCVRFREVSLRMAAALLRYAEQGRKARVLQDCDIAFDRGRHLRAGILLVREHRRGIIGNWDVHGAPDLAVEIACEYNARELRAKRRIYASLEVREVWIIYPESEKVEVLAWTEAGYVILGRYGRSGRVCSPLLPDMRLPLCGIFPREK